MIQLNIQVIKKEEERIHELVGSGSDETCVPASTLPNNCKECLAVLENLPQFQFKVLIINTVRMPVRRSMPLPGWIPRVPTFQLSWWPKQAAFSAASRPSAFIPKRVSPGSPDSAVRLGDDPRYGVAFIVAYIGVQLILSTFRDLA